MSIRTLRKNHYPFLEQSPKNSGLSGFLFCLFFKWFVCLMKVPFPASPGFCQVLVGSVRWGVVWGDGMGQVAVLGVMTIEWWQKPAWRSPGR